VMDDKQRIALVETRTFPRSSDPDDPLLLIRYQFGNHLGSASLELDEQARIIFYEEYSPYGSSTYQAVRSQTETAKRYRYTGKERDEESGLYYHGARYYTPWLGRWISCDRLLNSNRYEYCKGRPSVSFDIGGLGSNRQLMGLDDASVDASLAQDPSLSNVVALAAKQTAYDVWNVLTAGFVSKHDAIFEAREAGKISDSEYWSKTTGEASKSMLVVAVSAATGGGAGAGAKTLLGAVAKGAARGAASGAASNVAADLTEQTADVVLSNKESIDLSRTAQAAMTGAVTGAVFGGLGAGLAKVKAQPKANSKSQVKEEKQIVGVPGQKTRLANSAEADRFAEAQRKGQEYVAVTENPAQPPKVTWGQQTEVDLPDVSRATKIDHPHAVSNVAGFSTADVNTLMQSNAPDSALLTVQGKYGPTKAALANVGEHVNIPGASADDIVTTFITKGDMVSAFTKAGGNLRIFTFP